MDSSTQATANASKRPRVATVVVTFNPSLAGLEKLLHAVTSQVDDILVIDNGSANSEAVERLSRSIAKATYVPLGRNAGIGHAQNAGFHLARERGAAFVLTLDQDSVPSAGMVAALLATHAEAAGGRPVAAVGPLLEDESTGLPLPFFSYADGRKTRITPSADGRVLDVDFLVSSGTLIAMPALERIGLMRAELFIAYVDVEFCLRARSAGLRVLACCSTSMAHNLGDRRLRIGRWMIPLHSPMRHFHLMRSGLYMQKLATVPAVWKRADRRQLARSFVLFSIAGLPRLQEISAMSRGILAGFRLKVRPVAQFGDPES